MLKADIEKEKDRLEEENKVLKEKNKETEDKISKLEEMMNKILEQNSSKVEQEEVKQKEETPHTSDVYAPIAPNAYIKVTSLFDGRLNLTPQRHGKGTPFEFNGFAQSRNITYQTLENIVNSNRKMAEKGRYYIQNKQAVQDLMLDRFYEKILDEETIKKLVDEDDSNIVEMLRMVNDTQKDLIVSLLIDKIVNDGKNTDYNRINSISEVYGKDVITMIQDAKTTYKK